MSGRNRVRSSDDLQISFYRDPVFWLAHIMTLCILIASRDDPLRDSVMRRAYAFYSYFIQSSLVFFNTCFKCRIFYVPNLLQLVKTIAFARLHWNWHN